METNTQTSNAVALLDAIDRAAARFVVPEFFSGDQLAIRHLVEGMTHVLTDPNPDIPALLETAAARAAEALELIEPE